MSLVGDLDMKQSLYQISEKRWVPLVLNFTIHISLTAEQFVTTYLTTYFSTKKEFLFSVTKNDIAVIQYGHLALFIFCYTFSSVSQTTCD